MNSEIDDIMDWLNGTRDFDAGLMLHLAYLNDRDEYDWIKRQQNKGKLYEALRGRFMQLKAVSKGADREVSKNGSSDFDERFLKGYTEKVIVQLSDTLMEELKRGWMILKTEQESWHTEMRLIGANSMELNESERKQRATLADLILRHEKQLYELGAAMNELREKGSLPKGFELYKRVKPVKRKKKPVPLNDSEKILKLKNSILPGISKLKKKIEQKKATLAAMSKQEREKANDKLTDWENQLLELEQEKSALQHGKGKPA